jgi:protein-tyrosine phosphatase
MIPLVDTHCHLLAGLDDGPRTAEEALEMCRLAYADGTRLIASLAHQNAHWPAVTPERIRAATRQLAERLQQFGLPLAVVPCAEVMLVPELESAWKQGALLSVADRGQYLLLEMPHGLMVDLRAIALRLRPLGVRPILAHAERYPELLHDPGLVEQWIAAGCLIQGSARGVTDASDRKSARALKDWFERGIVHLLGSDGHSPGRRPPVMAEAYHRIARWAGIATADRVCSTNGTAVLYGLPLQLPEPRPRSSRWFLPF